LVFVPLKKKKNNLPPQQTVEVGQAGPNEGVPRRNYFAKEQLLTKLTNDVESLYHNFERSAKVFADKHCYGYRTVVKEIVEKKVIDGVEKDWLYLQLSEYKWLSYRESFERLKKVGSGLSALGLQPGTKIGIYEDTRLEWSLCCHGAISQSIVVVTIYANLGEDGVSYAIAESELRYLITNGKFLDKLAKLDRVNLKVVIYFDEANEKGKKALEAKGTQVLSFEELEHKGEKANIPPHPPKRDDVAVIMYTSGSTGDPKGVVITHGNLLPAVQGIYDCAAIQAQEDEVYISYLPLAHVLALTAENCMLHYGVAIGFGNPRTLVDSAVRNCKGDLAELRPTLMAGVPTVFDRVKKAARDKLEKSPFFVRTLFSVAYAIKRMRLYAHAETPLLDLLVFNKLKNLMGGRLRGVLSGGAPLSRDTQEFLLICFCCPVVQGYGLTETCGGGTVARLDDPNVGTAGPCIPCCEIKLVDVEELGYKHTDKPRPRGEVWIRGPHVTSKGYYNNEEKTKESFRGDWFATGDIGQWNSDGTLSIIDRLKNLVKLSHGEYLALESIESKLKNSSYVDNVCVCADSEKSFCVALVYPSKEKLMDWASKNNVGTSFEKVCEDPKAREEVLKSLKQAGQQARLKSFELPRVIHLCSDEWSPDNGLLTAAMKLRRGPIVKHYKEQIEKMYGSINE